MNLMFVRLLIVLILYTGIADLRADENRKLPFSTIAENLEWKGIAVEDPDFSIWGTSPVLGPDGKIHLFVARWPEMNVTPGWRKSSEIAHYVGDCPEGPFTFSDIALQGTGKDTWDKYGTHNPEIRRVGDEYVLLYIANTDYHQPPHPSNQRIGMALSTSLYGPWKKVSGHGMIIEKSEDPGHWTYTSANGLSNPTFIHSEGKYYVYFKTRPGSRTTQYGVAVADHLEGPYRILDRPVTETGFLFEDPNAFEWNGRHCLIADDNFGEFTGIRGGGILWQVTDFLKLNAQDIQIGFDLIPRYFKNYDEQIVTKIYGDAPKFERPKILLLDGRPAYLYAASGWNVYGGPRTVSYVLKINFP